VVNFPRPSYKGANNVFSVNRDGSLVYTFYAQCSGYFGKRGSNVGGAEVKRALSRLIGE